MVMEFDFTTSQPLALWQFINTTDVMVRAYEKRVIGIVEKRPDRADLRVAGLLFRSRGVEANDHEGIDADEKFVIERMQTGIRPAFGVPNRISGPFPGQIREMLEIRQLYVVEKTADTLIEFHRIGELFELRPEQPAQLKQRRESIL